MIISHKYKFIFIKTVKTAGTSIEVFLSKHCGENDVVTPITPLEKEHLPRNYKGTFNVFKEMAAQPLQEAVRTIKDYVKRRRFYNHIPAWRVRTRATKETWESYYKFCFERNPWDKTVSHYYYSKHQRGGNLSFGEYISRRNFPLNYLLYTDGHKHEDIIVDHVGKYESLSDELTTIFHQLGIPFEGALNIHAKDGYRKDKRPYQELFSDEHRKVIENMFQKEIELHGYTFD